MMTPVLDSGDTAWMLTATVLVLLMCLPGLALFYGGLVRCQKRAQHLCAVLCLGWRHVRSSGWPFGYAVAAGSWRL